jgi:NAD(P)-dependent dehydrogenase (short-subunit alcohol dehydrogenase family)
MGLPRLAFLLALTRGLAHAYGREGFRVNALVPGAIHTSGTDHLRGRAMQSLNVDLVKTGIQFGTRLALGHWGNRTKWHVSRSFSRRIWQVMCMARSVQSMAGFSPRRFTDDSQARKGEISGTQHL